MCAVLADGRRDGDGLQRHKFSGHSPVGGRQVILHHQSAGAEEFKCRSKNVQGSLAQTSESEWPFIVRCSTFFYYFLVKIETKK